MLMFRQLVLRVMVSRVLLMERVDILTTTLGFIPVWMLVVVTLLRLIRTLLVRYPTVTLMPLPTTKGMLQSW